jgi:hypothetical protein
MRAEAAKRGVDAEGYARTLLRNVLSSLAHTGGQDLLFYITATPDEWTREFHAFVQSFDDVTAPPIPEDALRRESLYQDRS